MRVFKHLRSNWFRYGFETLAVVVGILIGFALDNWNDQRKTVEAAEIYKQKIISDIVADTVKINGLIENSRSMKESIDASTELQASIRQILSAQKSNLLSDYSEKFLAHKPLK